jgi:DNA polymerase-3 subunit delta'
MLKRSVARGTLPPSLIFSGPPGVGKATTALALAEALNCERLAAGPAAGETSAAWDACGECASCRRLGRAGLAFRTGRERPAIDCLQWLGPDDKGSIKIDPVRAVLGRAGFRPLDGRARVVIIDEAHELEVPAQQALLKMLEEPPSATRFVLVTPQPDRLVATIRSRCPQIRFGPLSRDEICQILVGRHGWSVAEAEAGAAWADGGLGEALGRGDSPLRQARAVAAEVLEEVTGSRRPADRLSAAQTLVARLESGRDKAAKGRGGTASREEVSRRLDALSLLLRDIGVLTTRADRRCLVNADLVPRLDAMAPAFAGDRLTRAFAAVDRARGALERNASQKVVGDWLVLNL